MSVLVTGGAGYIGSHVALELLAQDERVIVLDNFSTGSRAHVPQGAVVVEGDVRDAAVVTNILRTYRVNSIMHFAGLIVVPESVTRPLDYYRHNVQGSISLIGAAVQEGVPYLIFSSSAAVYGKPLVERVSEALPMQPINPYGMSKAMTEQLLQDVSAAHGLRYVALRYFNVAGADPHARSGYGLNKHPTHLVPAAVQAAAGRLSGFKLYGDDYETADGTCVRDYIHVSDLACAHVDALRYLAGGGESAAFNCGYGRGFSVREVLDVVRKRSGKEFEIEIMPRREGDPPVLVADASRIRDVLGWTPQYDNLDTIVEHELQWLESESRKDMVKAQIRA